MLRVFGTISLVFACVLPAGAQERAPNPGTQGVLRSWPTSGVWNVALIRLFDGPLGCILATGHADTNTGEQYAWGIRWRHEGLGASISDNNRQAVDGPSIQIIIDNIPIGTYQMSRKLDHGRFVNAVADLPSAESDRILSLITVGGSMQYVTSNFTYSASLQGAKHALEHFKECITEATHLKSSAADRR
jgi:hypothetical protein